VGGDLDDGAPLAGLVEFLQGLSGAFEGVGATALGSGDEVVAVVTAHRMSPFRNMFRCQLRRTGSRFVLLRGW
jgi:hypothetical protein